MTMHRLRRSLHIVLAAAVVAGLSSCATKGLLSERYEPSFYAGVDLLPAGTYDHNPRFLAYGDTQSGWRFVEKFMGTDRWLTKKAFIFPFFYLYNVGEGFVGAVNWIRQTPDYGGRERRMVRDAVYAEVERSHPDFLLHLGDICMNDGRRPSHWATFLEESKNDVPLLSSIPVVPVIGNHEHANDERYGMPNYEAVFPETPRFYVLEFPDLALFVVDSNFILDQYGFIDEDEQQALWRTWIEAPEGQPPGWLQRELASHTQRFKIVAMHHPPVSIGHHSGDWARSDWGRGLRAKRRAFLNLLMDNGVQLVLSGHEHIYEHTTVRRLKDGDLDDAVLNVVITSGGGAPVRSLMGRDDIERYCEEFLRDGFIVDLSDMERVHHYSVVDVTPGELRVDTYRVDSGGKHSMMESIVIPEK
jgi:3',5'-cyclic AMP phosphodiesterase CpdA